MFHKNQIYNVPGNNFYHNLLGYQNENECEMKMKIHTNFFWFANKNFLFFCGREGKRKKIEIIVKYDYNDKQIMI